jgi:hypothetical protein
MSQCTFPVQDLASPCSNSQPVFPRVLILAGGMISRFSLHLTEN